MQHSKLTLVSSLISCYSIFNSIGFIYLIDELYPQNYKSMPLCLKNFLKFNLDTTKKDTTLGHFLKNP